jgi:hypothetical protein
MDSWRNWETWCRKLSLLRITSCSMDSWRITCLVQMDSWGNYCRRKPFLLKKNHVLSKMDSWRNSETWCRKLSLLRITSCSMDSWRSTCLVQMDSWGNYCRRKPFLLKKNHVLSKMDSWRNSETIVELILQRITCLVQIGSGRHCCRRNSSYWRRIIMSWSNG